jgi:soluble lytic murein transglycosylase-like protein
MREQELRTLARQMAERYGLDPEVFLRQIQQESGFNPQARNRRTGATGLGQVMSATAQDPGFGSHL